jgi:hypothetical protein
VLNDNGTLTTHDCDQLQLALAPWAIISRAEAEERMSSILVNRPRARAYRQRQIYAF